MGKLYSYTYVSLDGVVESPEAWVAPFFGEELADDLTRRLSAAAAMVLGRRTYEEFARFWPKQGDDVPFAALNNSISKIAVSGTLEHADWQNTRVIRDGDIEQVKRDASGDLHITGSATLVRSWIERAIIDEGCSSSSRPSGAPGSASSPAARRQTSISGMSSASRMACSRSRTSRGRMPSRQHSDLTLTPPSARRPPSTPRR